MAFPDVADVAQVPQEPAPPGSIESAGGSALRSQSPLAQAWGRFQRNKAALLSLAVLLIAGLLALFAPLLTHHSPIAFQPQHMLLNSGPSPTHWLGTDGLGRDYYTRLLYGLRGPLAVAFSGAFLCSLIGATTGIVAGYWGGWMDEILSRITEIIFVIPGFLLVVLCVSLFGAILNGPFGTAGRYIMITLFLATDSWPVIMRLARAETLSMKNTQFIEAAVVCGTPTSGIIRRHLLPNMVGIIMVQGSLLLPGFLFATAALGVIGLGAQPPEPDIGQLITEGATVMGLNDVEVLAPTIVMTTLILAATFLGDGLRDAFDTRSK